MIWIGWSLIALGAAVAGVIGAGAALPRDHAVRRRMRLSQPAAAVWHRITDYEGATAWRSGLKRVERLPDHHGNEVWRETSSDAIDLETTLVEPPHRLVRRIAGNRRDFGGQWEYEIVGDGAGTLVTITERGEVYNPLFRFVSRFILGHTRTVDAYLRDLGSSFGEAATIEDGG
jgi:uncharacterized protein YndB with AHSA1/START domain